MVSAVCRGSIVLLRSVFGGSAERDRDRTTVAVVGLYSHRIRPGVGCCSGALPVRFCSNSGLLCLLLDFLHEHKTAPALRMTDRSATEVLLKT